MLFVNSLFIFLLGVVSPMTKTKHFSCMVNKNWHILLQSISLCFPCSPFACQWLESVFIRTKWNMPASCKVFSQVNIWPIFLYWIVFQVYQTISWETAELCAHQTICLEHKFNWFVTSFWYDRWFVT